MWRVFAIIFGITALTIYTKDEEKIYKELYKEMYEAEPYDRIGSFTQTELVEKFSLAQLEVAYIESVSLDNRTAQRRLKKAIARKKFIEEWQTEGVQLW